MYKIPKITEEIKASVYETIIYTSKLLFNNIELEHAEKYDPKAMEEYFENIHAFDSALYPEDKLMVMKEQYISGLRNIFSVDLAVEKIKYDIQELTSKLISKLKYTVTLLDNDFKNIVTKKYQIDTLIKKSKDDLMPFIDAAQHFNASFETKEKLLSSCQKTLTTAYGGKLFLSHSVEDLLKILWNVLNNLFVLEETNAGRELCKKYDLDGCSAAIKYFISKEKIKDFKEDEIMKFDAQSFLKDFHNLPKQLKSDSGSIEEFIISLHKPDPSKQPDSPATTSEAFNESLKAAMMVWARASGIFDSNLRMMLEETSSVSVDPIMDIVTNIEESYRGIINSAETTEQDFERELTNLNGYVKLLKAGVTVMYFGLQCKVYDILRYLINFDFFLYIKNILNMLYLNFANDSKNEGDSGNTNNNSNTNVNKDGQMQTPVGNSEGGETPKPDESNPNPEAGQNQ